MKLRDLFTNGERLINEDLVVKDCVSLEYGMPDMDVLRWWNGKGPQPQWPQNAGALIIPMEWASRFVGKYNALVLSNDPKRSFFDAVRTLFPDGRPCDITTGFQVKVHPSAVIGADGFGIDAGKRVPHIGHVQLGNQVEIGAHTCVDRATLGATYIGHGTKVDNLVHIAHNVRIGTDCQVVAGAVIGGSAVIGDRVFIGMGALIKNKVRIGDDAVIGMGAVVTKDVPAGETWVGNPARKLEK